jgi:hypothetical protein
MSHEKPFRWYLPEDARSAVDSIESCKAIIRYLSETISQEALRPEYDYRLTEQGLAGLYLIYSVVEDVLDDCVGKLLEGVK